MFKYLGIIIDDKLNFKQMINYTISQITTKIHILKRNVKYLNEQTTYRVVNAIIYSVMNYGIEIYYNITSQKYINQLNKLFDNTLRLINKSNTLAEIKKKYNIMTPYQRYVYFTSIWIYKSIKSNEKYFKITQFMYTTRYQSKLKQMFFKFSSGKKSIFGDGVKVFYQLPLDITKEESLKAFKTRLKKYILELNQ